MMAVGAFLREESRGGHFRSDFPEQAETWKHRTYMTLAEADAYAANIAEKA